MSWYTTGTVAVTNGSTDVIAIGTQFITNTKAGDIFVVLSDGMIYEIDEVVSATQLKLKRPYAGASGEGLQYEIVPTASYLKTLASQVADLITLYTNVPEEVAASATAAADSAKEAAASAGVSASSAAAAAGSKDAAKTSEANAASFANAAGVSKTAAATSASNADASKTAAATSAMAADTSATAAAASATAAAASATVAAASKDAAATSASNAAATLANALTKANNLSDVADKGTARSNLDVPSNAALTDVSNGKVDKTGGRVTGPLTLSSTTNYSRTVWDANGYTPSIQADKAANQIGFVNAANTAYNLWVYDDGHVATRGSLTVGGSSVGGGSNATYATDGNVYGSVWGGWLSNWLAANKMQKTGDNATGRFTFSQPGWQADLGLRNWRSGQDAWVWLRARDTGGLDIINSAYNAVTWQVDNGGTTWQLGAVNVGGVRIQTDGNIVGGSMPWGDLFSAINVKVNVGTQATHRTGVNEFASINVGSAANTADAGSPWVLIGLRSQSGSSVTYLRANWLAVG